MSYQVGDTCYATLADAGAAACIQFPVATQVHLDGTISYLQCIGLSTVQWQANLGYLRLSRRDFSPSTGAFSYQIIDSGYMSYQPCLQQQYVDAGLSVFQAFLTLFAVCYSAWLIFKYLQSHINWSRGDD